MSITQLEYIIAVATYKSFVAAARKCEVTQPTLSMQIQKLEDEFGVKIFERTQPVSTTPIGALLIEQAKTIVEECDKMKLIISGKKVKSLRKITPEQKTLEVIIKTLKEQGLI